jgi:hypothetical protein
MAEEPTTKSDLLDEPAPTPPIPEKPTPASTGFTLEQIKAWADKPLTPAPQEPVQYSLDQVKQWAERGTGSLEPSPLLKQEPGIAGFLFPELQTNIGRVVAQSGLRAGLDAAAGLLGLGGAATAGARGLLTPESGFEGRSVADVQAERDRLQAQLDQSSAETDRLARSGQLTGEALLGAGTHDQVLQARIDAANKYIASGGRVSEGPLALSQSLAEFSRGFRTAQAGVQAAEAGIPSVTGEVPAQFAQSPLGTGAAIGGQLVATLPLMVADPAAATAVFAGQGFQGFYRDAKEHGADDRTATMSGLVGASLAPLQTGMLDVPSGTAVDMLAKVLGGQSSKQITAEIIGSVTRGGVIMGGTQFTQNLTARMQGYDPNRPLDEDVVRQTIFGAALDTIASVTRQFARRRGETPERPAAQTQTRGAPPPPAAPPALPQAEGDVIDQASRDFDKIMPEVGTPEEALRAQPAVVQAVPAQGVVPAPPAEVTAAAPTASAATQALPEVRETVTPPPVENLPFVQRAVYQTLARTGMDPQEAYDRILHTTADNYDDALRQAREVAVRPPQFARLVGPGIQPTIPTEALSQADARAIVNRAAESAGVEGKILYAPNVDALPRRIRQDVLASGQAQGAQTIWDHRDGQLWVIGDAFGSAAELHRTLIEEAIPRIFDHGQNPIAMTHDPEDPRLGWWDPVGQQAVVNTAQLGDRADPMLDASKTAVHESVWHAGVDKLFNNTPQGVAAYNDTMDRVRGRFDSTGESQQLAISRGFESVDAMSKAYGELYGLSGDDLRRAVTEELIGVYAEERFPTRASLEQSPRWYQDSLGRLGSAIRREFGWKLSDWDVQQLVRDSYGATRPGKTSTGVGAVPVRAEAIRPDGHAMAVMDNRSVTDPARANIGQLETGHPLTEPQMEALYNRLEGSGHPIGIMSRPEGPILINYNERALPNETFQELAGRAVNEVLGSGHSIQFARNEGTYASNDPVTIRASRTPDPATAFQAERQPSEPAGLGGTRELLPAAQRLGEPGRSPTAAPVRQPIGPARASSAEPLRDGQVARGGPTSAADVLAANARRGTPAAAPPRATYERASLRDVGQGGGPNEPRPDAERGTEDERIARARAATAAGLRTQEGLRQFGAQQAAGRVPGATFAERLAANTREGGAVYGKRPDELVSAEGRAKFAELGSDSAAAIDFLRQNREYALSDAGIGLEIAASDALRTRETSLRESGDIAQADRVQSQIQQFNSEIAARSTIKAQALSAERLRYENGDSVLGRTQRAFSKTQGKRLGTEPVVDEVQKQVADMRNDLVRQAINKLSGMFEKAQARIDRVTGVARDESLADRYIRYRSELINSWGARQGAAPAERAILDEAFGRFARTVREKIQEQVSLPKLAPPERMTAGERVQESLRNWPMLDRLWKASLDRLKGDNPNSLFFSRLAEEMGAPISDAQVRSVLGELKGVDIRSLAQQTLGVRDRISDSMSERLTRDVGLSSDQAIAVERHIADAVNRLVQDSQRTQLQALLDKLQTDRFRLLTAPRRQTELDAMMRMLNLGAFSKEDYYNAISERFGLPSWNQEMVDGIRSAGDRLQEIQAERGPHELAEQYQAQIADLLMQANPKWSRRYAQSKAVWYASLLTGPTTHIPYFMANGVKAMIDLTMRNLDGLTKGELTPKDILSTYATAARQLVDSTNWSEFRATLETGYRQHRPGAAEPGTDVYGLRSLGALPHRGGLEALPLPGGRSNPLNWYKYVPRALEAINGLFYRSADEAIMRNIALREAQDRYPNDPAKATRWASEAIFGSEQMQAVAQERASREALTYNWTEAQQRRRVQELIREARPAELSEEAHRFALHAFFRESPIATMGNFTRAIQELQQKKGGWFWTLAVPFTNIAGNVANEGLNWTPLGWSRARNIEGIYEKVPGMDPEDWSPRERSALQAEYYWKANIGATLLGGLGIYLVSQLSNPNPYFNIHGTGPTDQNEKNTWLATGAKPFTIKVGDRYFRYADWPIAIVLGALGQLGDVLRYDEPKKVAAGKEADYAIDSAFALFHGAARVLSDHSFLQSMVALTQLLSAQGTQMQTNFENYVANFAASFERIGMGGTGAEQIYRMFDPQTYETKSAAGKLFSQVPFAARALNLEPKVNMFGEPIDNNSLYRILGYPGRPDPLYQFLSQHNIGMSIPQFGKILYPGTSTPLDMAQFQRYLQERGQSFKTQLSDRLEELSRMKPDELQGEIQSMERDATDHAQGVITDTYPEPKE